MIAFSPAQICLGRSLVGPRCLRPCPIQDSRSNPGGGATRRRDGKQDDLGRKGSLRCRIMRSRFPRLNIPEYDWWNEGLHGIARSGYATVFPQAIGLAATWDTALLHDTATVISTEARAKNANALQHDNHSIYYGLDVWSPNINIFRDPRWGRGQETYGEDPFLTSRMGRGIRHGLQGDDPRFYRVISTPKHFAVHSGPESTRHTVDVKASPHDLEDNLPAGFPRDHG